MRFLLLLFTLLFAQNVKLHVNKKTIIKGEKLEVSITASGKQINIPNLKYISNYPVEKISTTNEFIAMNGRLEESLTKTFIIYPESNFTIPPIKVRVNNQIFFTTPLHITVKKPQKTEGRYSLDINLSKNRLYLGDIAILTISFTAKKPPKFVQIITPNIKSLSITPLKKIKYPNKAVFKYILKPKKSGTFTIGPLKAVIGTESFDKMSNQFFSMNIKTTKNINIYSNSLKLTVLPIPNKSIFGDFNISASIQHSKLISNSPNRLRIKITGCGDLESIKPVKLSIPNTTVYPSKAVIEKYLKKNQVCGFFEQNFTIISPHSYLIPPLTLHTFYNKKLKTLKTEPIQVDVLTPTIHSQERIIYKKEYNLAVLILIFISGAVIGTILSVLVKKEPSLLWKIKRAKTQKELLSLLNRVDCQKIEEIKSKLQKEKKSLLGVKREVIKILKSLK